MIDQLLSVATHGGEAILFVLFALSLLSVAVIIERFIAYTKNRIDLPRFSARLVQLLNERDIKGALEEARSRKAAEARVAAEALNNFDKSRTTANELMESMSLRQQQQLDRWLGILGTIGSNAPFIGLLGTVLGIIRAFNDLAYNTEGGPSVVMAGIAEALVATAVGLFVAIPAVIFFNYFKGRQKKIINNIGQLQRMLLAFMGERDSANRPSPSEESA
jgi:biopolymer transport protein ExbB